MHRGILSQQVVIADVTTANDLDGAFAGFAQRGVGAILVGAGGFLTSKRSKIVALAAQYQLPASL